MSKDDWIKINCHTKRQKAEKSPNKRAPQTHDEWEKKTSEDTKCFRSTTIVEYILNSQLIIGTAPLVFFLLSRLITNFT